MCRTPSVVVIPPRISAGFDRHEAITAIATRKRAAAPGEIRIERGCMIIDRMAVATGRVGLPDFNQAIRYWFAVLIEHSTADDYAFAQRLSLMLACKILIVWFELIPSEEGPCDL